mgnify:CR=1 FL=1
MDPTNAAQARRAMVAQIEALATASLGHGLDRHVLDAMASVPRHDFVPPRLRDDAHADRPLPIGCGKTISQPFIVALMTDLLGLQPAHRVLEIGTGCGYQTAVLAALAGAVYSVERMPALADEARQRLAAMGLARVHTRVGDGWLGWPEQAPFDRIIVTAAPPTLPQALVEQLRPGGRLVLPLGPDGDQQLTVIDKDDAGRISRRAMLPVRFSALDPGPGTA